MMDTLANVNLREELAALDVHPEAIAAPTIGHRIWVRWGTVDGIVSPGIRHD